MARRRLWGSIALLACALAPACSQDAEDPMAAREPGYEYILDGTSESFDRWLMTPAGSFELRPDGSIRSVGGLGMLWYPEEHGDVSLKLEYRDGRTDDGYSNGGVFVRFPDPRTPVDDRPACGRTGLAATSEAWVPIFCGQEIQINDSPADEGDPQKTGSIYNFAPLDATQSAAERRLDREWHTLEIRVVGQRYTVLVDGAVVNEFDNAIPREAARAGDPPTQERQFARGYVGLQNHGGHGRDRLPERPRPAARRAGGWRVAPGATLHDWRRSTGAAASGPPGWRGTCG